jgi:hypothetical protein
MWGILSDERMDLLFTIPAGPCQRSHSWIRVRRDSSQIRDAPNLEGQVPYLYPPETGWPSYIPRHWVPFWSPPTTCRATVEVFEPASTRGATSKAEFLLNKI